MIHLGLDDSVSQRWQGKAVLGLVCLEGLSSASNQPQLDSEIKATISELQKAGNAALQDTTIQQMRITFRAMPDMDPSRYRPASEALIRRCLEKDLMRINAIVDLNNMLSIRFRLPLGIYDLDRISANCVYRIGHSGESYTTISQAVKSAEGKLVVADDSGVVGSPVSDSGRAVIRSETTGAVVIAYLPFGISENEGENITTEIENAFMRHFQAKTLQKAVLTI